MMIRGQPGSSGRPAVRALPGRRQGRLAGIMLALVALALLVLGGAGCGSSVPTRVVFLDDWEAAKEQAASQGKPIMINFYTDT